MNRRRFIGAAGTIAALGPIRFLYSGEPPGKEAKERAHDLIFSVQRHFFPTGLSIPDAEAFGAMDYFKEALAHHSFDPDIRTIIYEGARRLEKLGGKEFIDASSGYKEKILRRFEQENFGAYWLALIMNLSLEALLSDPIYGGNIDESGWKAFGLSAGRPRPKKRYCGV